MKCIGIIGGLSPESTIYYYQHIIHQYYKQFNNHNYPKIVIYSVSFQDYIDWGARGNTKAIEDDLVAAVSALERAGAEFALISANTPHSVFDAVYHRVKIPMFSIIHAVRDRALELGLKKLVVLGTTITMTGEFYPNVFKKAGLEILTPSTGDQKIIHDIIFKELSLNIINPNSKKEYQLIINKMIDNGADGVILGCTEIPLLVKPEDIEVPVLDSAKIHAEAALKYALGH